MVIVFLTAVLIIAFAASAVYLNLFYREENKMKTVTRNAGDFISINDFTVPKTEIDGVSFDKLTVHCARLVTVSKTKSREILMFDHVIFSSIIDKNAENKTFSDTALGKYLDGIFKNAITEQLGIPVKKISLITEYEMFGTGNKESNFDETPKRFNFFKQGINRIRFDSNEDYSRWYWLGSKIKGFTTYFCYCGCSGGGFAGDCDAADSGAVPPALMI